MHMVAINKAMCDTGHLHISSLAYSEHRHHQNDKINFRLYLVKASVKFAYQAKIDF